MGVPSFYRWLVGKYPKAVVNAIEERGEREDTTLPNPNGEFDNLYLDLNGIVHPCFHPEDQLFPPKTYDEVFAAIFEYIDRIFGIVRPRKLLFMAIDGVAPRAKMNQQRGRRFRTAKDAEIAYIEEERLRSEFAMEGKNVLPKEESEVSDSNVITPGTVFMEKLSKALEYYIRLRLNRSPSWKDIKVILSDASVPGEGEHKIMSFIRLQRNLPGYDPNTRHCLYGLDADLIMLALATHEVHFSILREDILMREQQENCMASVEVPVRGTFAKKPYQFLNIWTLREYLELDMRIPDPPFEIEVDRIVDDFIFICFFTGNDFLPHSPSIEIHEGGIDLLIDVYKKVLKTNRGYLVDTSRMKEKKAAYIKVKRVEKFIAEVGSYEERIFEKRTKLRQRKIQRFLREMAEEDLDEDHGDNMHGRANSRFGHIDSRCNSHYIKYRRQKRGSSTFRNSEIISADFAGQCNIYTRSLESVHHDELEAQVIENTIALRQKLKALLRGHMDLFKNGALDNDKVKLGCPGWKSRYYQEKFCMDSTEIESIRKRIVEKYMEGLCWVLQYYFAGVCSWSWYYPFLYGPFASDLKGLSCSHISFKMGSPFKPLDQLMAVFPPQSSSALPEAYRKLMNFEDSPIIKFYPTNFVVDTDGKRYLWQGVPNLPFIEEGPLITATMKAEKELKDDEVERNTFKYDKIFVRDSHSLGSKITSIYELTRTVSGRAKEEAIDCDSCGINGLLIICDDYLDIGYLSSPVKGMDDIAKDLAKSAIYKNPCYHDHVPRLLENVELPEKTIVEGDIVESRLWHEHEGGQPPRNVNHQRYTPKIEHVSKSDSRGSSSEGWSCAGSGWGGIGRGRGFVQSSIVGQDRVNSSATHARSGGRGRGLFDVGIPGECSDAFRGHRPTRGGWACNGGRRNACVGMQQFGESSNASLRAKETRNGGLLQQPSGSRADGSDDWQRRTTSATATYGRGRGRGLPMGPASSPRWHTETNRSSMYQRIERR